MQSPDGGLLNMDPPRLRLYRQRINGLFTRGAAEATRSAVRGLAAVLVAGLAARPDADVLASFAEPFTEGAVCRAMGIPGQDWGQVLAYSRVAFAVVPSPGAVGAVGTAWDDLYRYYGRLADAKRARPDGALISELIGALDGFPTRHITHVIGTVGNGFGAVLPVLAVALTELAQRPRIVASCLRGERTWDSVAGWLLTGRAMFPVALPRVARADTWLGGRPVSAGTVLLPSLIAAAHDPAGPPSPSLPFGAGPAFLPGRRAHPGMAGHCAGRVLRGVPGGPAGGPSWTGSPVRCRSRMSYAWRCADVRRGYLAFGAPRARASASSAWAARAPTRSVAGGRSVMRSMFSPAHTGSGGRSPQATPSR